MDEGDFWKLVVGGVVTVVGGWLLHQLQLGGRRRRLRRDIREQLELLKLLNAHPEIAERVRRRLAVSLERYEPAPEVRRTRVAAWSARLAMFAFLGLVFVLLELQNLDLGKPWPLIALGTAAAVVGIIVDEAVTRRLQTRDEEAAVAHGFGSGSLRWQGSGEGKAGRPGADE